MSLYAIGDLHLCLGAYKPMDVFGGRWEGYMEKLREGLSVIEPGDTTVLLGDLSWALGIEQAEKDFAFLHAFPGRKLILKGACVLRFREASAAAISDCSPQIM